jgi:hypothetical protein
MKRLMPLTILLCLTGCQPMHYAPPETPMPPNTVLLSQMMRDLSSQPGFTEAMLHEVAGAGANRKGPALLTPRLINELRKRILGKDWSGLDRFPGWTMREINPTVRTVGHFAGKSSDLEGEAAVHPGAAPATGNGSAKPTFDAAQHIDLGSYALNTAGSVDLAQPSTLPGFTTAGIVTQLGDGVTRGDGPNELAPEHAESQLVADVLNRLAVNSLDNAQAFHASLPSAANISTPQQLITALAASGHTVTVTDSRYFANFGHLHYTPKGAANAEDVMMPFWVNTRIALPGTGFLRLGARPLLIPVSHAELEWHIRGPHVNADISWYFGIDGKAEWRTMDTLDQAWVLRRYAHIYTGAQALEATRLTTLMTVAYMHQHERRTKLPFGGYYALGVCQDGVSAVEKKLTGDVTLFPNTVDAALFNDPRDAEVNAMMQAIPKDRDGDPPQPARVFGSMPAEPGADGRFNAITIPGLADDLAASYAAWREGRLHRTVTRSSLLIAGGVLLLFAGCAVWYWRKR